MPFTFSHPAAILPLTCFPSRFYSLTGLVIGSMTPDFEYFIRMRVYSSYSHTWRGLIWFNVPLALILAFIYHLIVRDKLIDNLPNALHRRLLVFKQLRWADYTRKNIPVVVASCMLGAATHILWDGFTHQNGYFVQAFPILQKNASIGIHPTPVFKILQHLSSLVGALAILNFTQQLPLAHPAIERSSLNWQYWLWASFVALSVVSIRLLVGNKVTIGDLIVSMLTGALIGPTLATILLSLKK